jgi:hypothetical protein
MPGLTSAPPVLTSSTSRTQRPVPLNWKLTKTCVGTRTHLRSGEVKVDLRK